MRKAPPTIRSTISRSYKRCIAYFFTLEISGPTVYHKLLLTSPSTVIRLSSVLFIKHVFFEACGLRITWGSKYSGGDIQTGDI